MRLYFAPLEGVTGYAFRRAHARHFAPADKYFAPFFSPTREHTLPPRVLRELGPEQNRGVPTVPQLLTRDAEDFLWAARALADMGYAEVNLNLGCPSGTVAAKGKGAGFLARPAELDAFLERVFAACPVPVSVKTRLGVASPEEFSPLLDIYARYPLAELIVHPRVQRDMYQNTPRLDAFSEALARGGAPVCYNGDIKTPEDARGLAARFPALGRIMLGRGAVADPGLFGALRGLPPPAPAALRAFHDELLEAYLSDFGAAHCALPRMKELWGYLAGRFPGAERAVKRLMKARDLEAYRAAAEEVLRC